MPVLDEASINARHRERIRQAMEAGQPLPLSTFLELADVGRQEWIMFYKAANEGDGPRRTRLADAAALIGAELDRRIGQTVRAVDVTGATGASEAAFYKYVADHPDRLSKIDRGSYLVRDVTAERAEAGRPTITTEKLRTRVMPATSTRLVSDARQRRVPPD